MTNEEIDAIFPPELGGNAQISDLRLILTYLAASGSAFGGINFYDVNSIPDRDQLQDLSQGDICLVRHNQLNEPETFIWDDEQWKVMVLIPAGGGGGTTYNKITEEFQIGPTEEAYQEVILTQTPTLYEHIFVFLNGLLVSKDDFHVVGNTIEFVSDYIADGDFVVVKYGYVP
jgi:hypothetical protein